MTHTNTKTPVATARERARLARHLAAWAQCGGPDDLFNAWIVTPSGAPVVVPMHIRAAIEIEEHWNRWRIECR